GARRRAVRQGDPAREEAAARPPRLPARARTPDARDATAPAPGRRRRASGDGAAEAGEGARSGGPGAHAPRSRGARRALHADPAGEVPRAGERGRATDARAHEPRARRASGAASEKRSPRVTPGANASLWRTRPDRPAVY